MKSSNPTNPTNSTNLTPGNPAIHPSAIVDPTAELGENISIGPHCVIERDTVIGDNCKLGPGVIIHPHVNLGDNCTVHAHAVLGDLPQDMAFADCVSHVEIGPGNVFREYVTVHRGTKPDTVTRIGANGFFMAGSHVAHNCQIGDEVIFANGATLGGYVQVGDAAFLSGHVVVHQFCRVGRLTMLSGQSAASKDIPPFCILHNSETNIVSGINIIGMRRAGIEEDERTKVRTAFRMIFLQGKNLRKAAESAAAKYKQGPANELAQFVLESERGVCAFRRS